MNSINHRFLAALGLGAFALQMASNLAGGYGYFIDELYYIACAKRLAWGYVDHPPLSPFLLRMNMAVFGDSLVSIRLLPAITGGVVAYLTGWLAAYFGGGRWAQGVAAIAVTLSPVFLIFFDVFSMNGFELLFWTSALAILLILVRTENPKLWLAFGALSGLALLNKHTMVTLGFGAVLGIALTPARKLLFNRWLIAGGVVAAVIFLPNLLWQWQHDFPSLEFYRNASLLKNRPSPPLTTLTNQLLFVNPVLFPLWAAGLFFLLRDKATRFAGLAYLILLTMLVISQQSRPDRIAGLYPMLFAAGAVFWESTLGRRSRLAFAAVAVAGCLAMTPMFQPLLPPAQAARYAAFVGVDTQIERGAGKVSELPQWLADRFGWEELVAQVTSIYEDFTPAEQERTLIVAPSYGHAGALELLSEDLPPVMSAHNTYHMWSRELAPRLANSVVIAIGWDVEALEATFEDVQRVATYTCEYCMSWRNDMAIHVARQPKLTPAEFKEAWELSKHYE